MVWAYNHQSRSIAIKTTTTQTSNNNFLSRPSLSTWALRHRRIPLMSSILLHTQPLSLDQQPLHIKIIIFTQLSTTQTESALSLPYPHPDLLHLSLVMAPLRSPSPKHSKMRLVKQPQQPQHLILLQTTTLPPIPHSPTLPFPPRPLVPHKELPFQPTLPEEEA